MMQNGTLTSPTLSHATSAGEKGGNQGPARALALRYGNPTALLAAFNPDRQQQVAPSLRCACSADTPALGTVAKAFGSGTAVAWLAVQLWNLAEFSGCKAKLSEAQVTDLANIIRAEYGYMQLAQLMHFFYRFKVGDYGKFYGAVDPQVITVALKSFAADRAAMLDKLRKEREEEARRHDPEHHRFLRAYERDRRSRKFYSLNFRSPDFSYNEFKEIEWLFNLGYERPDSPYLEP